MARSVAPPDRRPAASPGFTDHRRVAAAHAALQRRIDDSPRLRALGRHVARLAGGNTGPAAALVMQRALPSGADLLAQTDQTDGFMSEIAGRVNAFNELVATDAPQIADYNRLFETLAQIDRAIYDWFDTDVTPRYQKIDDHPFAATMKDLLVQTEREHSRLVEATKDTPAVLPFDTSDMNAEAIDDAKELWASILSGGGKIRLTGTAEYNRLTRSRLAKILSTPSGRKLLRYLNTPRDELDLANEMTHVYIGNRAANLPEAVRTASPEARDVDESMAQVLGAVPEAGKIPEAVKLGPEQPLGGDEDTVNDYKVIARAEDYREAVVGGKRGVILNGKKYDFRGGRGAYVQVVGDMPHPQLGPDFKETIGPVFTTLAHELGHAAFFKGGATTKDTFYEAFRNAFMEEYGGDLLDAYIAAEGKRDVAQKLWSAGSEEFLNIVNWENTVRAEAGLQHARTGHASSDILQVARYKVLNRKILSAVQGDPVAYELFFADFGRRLKANWKTLGNDGTYRDVSQELDGLLADFDPGSVIETKHQRLTAARGRLKTAYDAYPNYNWWFYSKEYTPLMAEVRDRAEAVVQTGQTEAYSDLLYRVKMLAQKIERSNG